MTKAVCRALIAALCLALALFFAFVGWNKAFAPMAELARHGAWTIHLPEALGRVVGWSEMVLATGLLFVLVPKTRQLARLAALALIANQVVAALVHAMHGESAALPQNAILIATLAFIAWGANDRIFARLEGASEG